MHRVLRCAFIALLATALAASGSALGAASHAAAHGKAVHDEHASHHAVVGEVHKHHHHVQDTAQDEALPQDHASNTCCSMCTVTSPLPPVAMSVVQFETSPAEYAARSAFGIALKTAVDPGIPKRMG